MDALNAILGNLSVSESIYDRLYAILGCTPSNTDAQISHEYRLLALKYHPDRCMHDGGPTEVQMTQFAEIQLAYGILGQPKERARYDAWLNSGIVTSYPLWCQMTSARYAVPDFGSTTKNDCPDMPTEMDSEDTYRPPMLHWAHSASLPSLTMSEASQTAEGHIALIQKSGRATCYMESNDVYAFPENPQWKPADSTGHANTREAWIEKFRSYDI